MTVKFSGTSILLIFVQPLKRFFGKWVTRVFDKFIDKSEEQLSKQPSPIDSSVSGNGSMIGTPMDEHEYLPKERIEVGKFKFESE